MPFRYTFSKVSHMFQEEGMTRKEREYQQRRQSIMETALGLFTKAGFHNTSMNQIAKASEFSVGTLYNFFANKEDLYHAMVHEKAQFFYKILASALESEGPPPEIIQRWVDAKIKLYTENRAFFSIFFVQSMRLNISMRAAVTDDIRALHQDLRTQLAVIFKQGISEGFFYGLNPQFMALALDGMVNSLLVSVVENPDAQPVSSDDILSIFYSSILKPQHNSGCTLNP